MIDEPQGHERRPPRGPGRVGGLGAVLALTTVGLGVALIASALVRGSGATLLVVGLLFVAAGAGRLSLLRGS
jgi:hypothetical protein